MKTIYFLIIALLIYTNVKGQQSFEKVISSDQDQIINSIIEVGGKYLLVGRIRNAGTGVYDGYVVELSNSGNIIEELQFSNGAKTSQFFDVHLFNEQLYLIGTQFINYPDTSKIWFVELNLDLFILKEELLNLPTGYWYSYMNTIIDTDTNIVIAGYLSNSNTTNIDPCLYKLDINGDSISVNHMTHPTILRRMIYDITESPDSSLYYAFGSRFGNMNDGGERITLNKDLDSIGIANFPNGIFDFYAPINLNDTSFLICGKGSSAYNAADELAVSVVDYELNSLYYNHFVKDENMIEHPCMFQGTSKNNNYIFVGGLSNFNPANPFYANNPSWFHLIKMNLDLTLEWEYWYGGDEYYFPYSILATSDGGCIMVGTRYDGEIQYVRDIYVVKVDTDGAVLWTQSITVQHESLHIYPNPGKNQINIKTKLSGFTFELFNLNGKLLLHNLQAPEINYINTEQLNSGIYFYRITDQQNGIIETGKWIKR